MEEMIIDSLKINAMGQRVLILKQKKGPLFLAIWIAAAEADAIAIRMQKVEIPRPLTHDLLCNAIEKSGGKIKSVQIEKVENGTFFGSLLISRANENEQSNIDLILDSRPSDAMVVALKLNIPIMCDKTVLEKAGFQKSKLDIDNPIEAEATVEENGKANDFSPIGEKERQSLSAFESFIDSLDIDE